MCRHRSRQELDNNAGHVYIYTMAEWLKTEDDGQITQRAQLKSISKIEQEMIKVLATRITKRDGPGIQGIFHLTD